VNGDINGDSLFFGDTTSKLFEIADNQAGIRVGADGPTVEFRDAGSDTLEIGNNTNGDLALTANSDEKVRITTAGFVGINTDTPDARLHVVGGLHVTNNTELNGNLTADGSITSANITVDTTTLVTDGTNNRVGIGTASPTETLHVVGTSLISSDLEVGGDMTVEGNLTVNGSTTTVTAANLSVSDNLIYMNQGVLATVTGAASIEGITLEDDAGKIVQDTAADENDDVLLETVTYTTSGHNYTVGMVVTVTGATPSSFNVNGTGVPIVGVSGDTFTIQSSNSDTYVSGGSARGKTSANPDLGFAGGYNDGSYAHAGFFRDATDDTFKVFHEYTPEPDDAVDIDTSHPSFALADFQAQNVTVNNLTVGGTFDCGVLT